MSSQIRTLMSSGFGLLRHEPTAKRIRAELGGETVVDSTRAVLVWEPRRIVLSDAVPARTCAASWCWWWRRRARAVTWASRSRRDGTAGARPEVPSPCIAPTARWSTCTRRGSPARGRLRPADPVSGRAGDPRLRRVRRLGTRRTSRTWATRVIRTAPHRRAAELPSGPAGAGGRGAGASAPGRPVVRDDAADPRTPPGGT